MSTQHTPHSEQQKALVERLTREQEEERQKSAAQFSKNVAWLVAALRRGTIRRLFDAEQRKRHNAKWAEIARRYLSRHAARWCSPYHTLEEIAVAGAPLAVLDERSFEIMIHAYAVLGTRPRAFMQALAQRLAGRPFVALDELTPIDQSTLRALNVLDVFGEVIVDVVGGEVRISLPPAESEGGES